MGTNSVVSYCRLTDKTEVEILGEWGYLSKYRILWLAGLLCSAVRVGVFPSRAPLFNLMQRVRIVVYDLKRYYIMLCLLAGSGTADFHGRKITLRKFLQHSK
ncbi:uncharacterized protein EAE97_008971 [Botrytis byssoidea]|uniref:Uncharacterized protein n=1 Tax=Botrytis byssoidea TaxID=139641 RepID=A0A9P5IB00_9HELO|nr:uncharacterized protein EAE97_008971 [Botrytis byssoidea]KAF7931950.1 hypothetical protein EAE97_008971 [Botrytis byssoidea]